MTRGGSFQILLHYLELFLLMSMLILGYYGPKSFLLPNGIFSMTKNCSLKIAVISPVIALLLCVLCTMSYYFGNK